MQNTIKSMIPIGIFIKINNFRTKQIAKKNLSLLTPS